MSKKNILNIIFFTRTISVLLCLFFFIYYIGFIFFILDTELYKCYVNKSCNNALREISKCENASLVQILYKEPKKKKFSFNPHF